MAKTPSAPRRFVRETPDIEVAADYTKRLAKHARALDGEQKVAKRRAEMAKAMRGASHKGC
jgi:hypothetical protein